MVNLESIGPCWCAALAKSVPNEFQGGRGQRPGQAFPMLRSSCGSAACARRSQNPDYASRSSVGVMAAVVADGARASERSALLAP